MNKNLIDVALALLQDEANGDIVSAKAKMDLDNYSMTWMYKSGETLFPAVQGEALKQEMGEAYEIQKREYEIVNTAQNGNVVFIEMVESYPDPKTGEGFRTPITLVLEFTDGKVVRGRHYTDPNLSHEHLSKEVIHGALGQEPKRTIRRQSV